MKFVPLNFITETQRIKASSFLRQNVIEWNEWDGNKRQFEMEKIALEMGISRLKADIVKLKTMMMTKTNELDKYICALKKFEKEG